MILSLALTALALAGLLAVIPLALRSGDRPGDARLIDVGEEDGFPAVHVTISNPGGDAVIVGLALRRPSLRLRLEGEQYARLRTRRVTGDLLPSRQTTVGVLAPAETGTFLVPAGAQLGSRAELVAVLGQAGRLRTIHRELRLSPCSAAGGTRLAAASAAASAAGPQP